MIEIVSTAKFAGMHKLRASGDGRMTVDGPSGFSLKVTLLGGDPCGYGRTGTGTSATLNQGQSITVKDRTEIWTTGQSSTVFVG